MKKVVIACAVMLPCVLAGCAASESYDSLHDQGWQAAGSAWSAADSPAGLVTSTWAGPHEVAAEDITLADAVPFTVGIVDTPFNTAPPPFGTMYYPWKLFVTVVRTFPFVTWSSSGDSSGTLTFAGGEDPGPLWYVFGPAFEEFDSWVVPVRETVSADHTPVPGGGDRWRYWRSRANSNQARFAHIGKTLKYYFLNANSDLPPFDRWFPDTLSRDKTTIHKTFDHWLFLYDWDDPYIN